VNDNARHATANATKDATENATADATRNTDRVMDHPPYAFDKKTTLAQVFYCTLFLLHPLEQIKNKIPPDFAGDGAGTKGRGQWGFVAIPTRAGLETVAFAS
jgi:hypothetical protein